MTLELKQPDDPSQDDDLLPPLAVVERVEETRDVCRRLASADPRAAEAIDLFTFSVSRAIAGMANSLGGQGRRASAEGRSPSPSGSNVLNNS